jgi:cell division septal protein FtsQ
MKAKTRVDLPRTNLRERRRKKRIVLGGLAVVAVLLFVSIVAGVTWLPFMRVNAVVVTGLKTIQVQQVQKFTLSEVAGTYGLIFAKSNILLYPRGTIEEDLIRQFPALATAQVRAENFHTLSITVTERSPSALWCGESTSSSTSCYLLDKTGTVYAPAVVYSGDAYQKYFGPITGGNLPRQFLTPAEFHALLVLIDSLQKKQNLSMQSISVDAVNDVRVTFTNGFTLIFALESNTGDLFERFSLALSSDVFVKHSLSDFAYLDLRFGDKLYYKLKIPDAGTTTKSIVKPQ